jgi:signal peptidase II
VAFVSITLAGCLLDLLTKGWAFRWLGPPPGPRWWLIPHVLGFETSLNRGALFGLGQGWVLVFAALSVLAFVAIVLWLFWARAARDLLLTVALSCISAGILGNLYDRLGAHGLLGVDGGPDYAVRDFILLMIFGWHWPNFNLADTFLVSGAILLLWHAYRAEPSPGLRGAGAAP